MSRKTLDYLMYELVMAADELRKAEDNYNEILKEIQKKKDRKNRYWQNKEIENQRSKVWRENKKLERLLKEKGDSNDD